MADKTYYYGDFDKADYLDYTGINRWNAIYTIQLGELVENGIFDWSSTILDWSKASYSEEQYSRVCEYFIERFRFREISIEPYYEWATMLHRKLVFELMPKYRLMYQYLDDDFDFSQDSRVKNTEHENLDSNTTDNRDEYFKRRAIDSDYPETLLSGNSDYASNGQDEESERVNDNKGTKNANTWTTGDKVTTGSTLDKYLQYEEQFRAIDKSLLDELESVFIGLFTMSINGW